MRVIAGMVKGRRLKAVPGVAVRPTADRVKEALFSILESRVALAGSRIADLFAGTGAIGIEALSRGAASVLFVEQDRAALRVLRANLAACGFEERGRVWAMPVRRAVRELAARGGQVDGVLVDPPYGRGLADNTLAALVQAGILRGGGWVAVEHHIDDVLAAAYGDLRLTTARRYGKTCLTLYVVCEREQAATS